MTDTVRCPSCRGAKKVPKLGGVIGECNTCDGEGKIKACDKVIPIINEPAPELNDLIKATANALPVSEQVDNYLKAEIAVLHDIVDKTIPAGEAVKVDGKRAIYKRKKA